MWEVSLVGVSLGTLGDLVIGTWEGYFVSLSLILPIGYPLESPNRVYVMPGMLLGALLRLWFVSELVRCWFYCCCFADFRETTCGGG